MNIGEAVQQLSFNLTLDDDRLVSDAIVIMRTVDPTTGARCVALAVSEGTDDVTYSGLLRVATIRDDAAWNAID